MSKIKYYIDDVRGDSDSSTKLTYHYVITEGTPDKLIGWKSYEDFPEDEYEYRSAFWEAVQYWYEDNDSIVYSISKKRDDGFYFYREFIDNIFVGEGYNQYTKLHTEKEQKAWMKALKDYNKTAGIDTPLSQLQSHIADVKHGFADIEGNFPKEQDLMIPSIPSAIAKILQDLASNNLGDDFLEHIFELIDAKIPTKQAIIQYALNGATFNLNLKYKKLLEGFSELGVSAFVSPVISKVLEMADNYLGDVDTLYNELTRVCNKPIRIYNKIVENGKKKQDKDTKALAKQYQEDFKEAIKDYSPKIKEFLYEIFYIDLIVKLIQQLRAIGAASIGVWRNIISEAKTLRDFDISEVKFSKIIPKLKSLLTALLPLLGGLIGALYGAECGVAEDQKVDLAGQKRSFDIMKGDNIKPGYKDLQDYTVDDDLDFPKLEQDVYNDEYVKPLDAMNKALEDVAIVYTKATKDEDKFSLYPCPELNSDQNTPENEEEPETPQGNINDPSCFPCSVSMCETDDDTDLGAIFQYSPINGNNTPRKVAVEIGQDIIDKARLCVSVGQHIRIDDIIGYIDDVPIRSNTDCLVEIVEPTYFVAWYFFEADNDMFTSETPEDYAKYIEDYFNKTYEEHKDKVNDYQKLIDFYKNSAYTDMFIKDYLSFFRFPELALFTRDYSYNKTYHNTVLQDMFRENFGVASGYRVANGSEVSSDKFIEKYEDEAHDIIDGYEKTIKKKLTKKKVKEYVKKKKTMQLKDMIYEEKKNFTEKILKLYKDNPGGLKYCSKGRIVDFMLCDNWIEYLHSDDFYYDDENPYVKQLSDAISKFIGIRERLELNKTNIESLISKFNETCDGVLKKYWFGYSSKTTYINNYNRNLDYNTTYDYFKRFKEVFKFEYYLNTDSIEEGSADDEGSISLFKRVYKYLKTLVGIKTNEPAGIEITENTDVTALLESYENVEAPTETEDDKMDRKLRQIAHRYVSLIRIENGMTESKIMGSQYTYIANEYKKIDSAMAKEYDGRGGHDVIIQTYFKKHEKVLSQYLQNLKTITANELVTLQVIAKNAIGWYNDHSEEFYNDSLFEQFNQIGWADPMEIYHECIQTNYYLFTDIYNAATMNFLASGGNLSDFNYEVLPGEGVMPVKSMKDLDKLEQRIAEDDKNAEKDDNLSTSVNSKTRGDITKLKYWLKYCLHATLVNCMVPLFWGTGILISGVPIPLPIIYIPFFVIPGRTICVIGIGLCGIFPWPMLLFVNASNVNSTIIPPLNIAIDLVIKLLEKMGQVNFGSLQGMLQPLINALDKEIQGCQDDLLDLDYQKDQLKMLTIDSPRTEYLVKRELNIEQGIDNTSHREDTPPGSTEYAQARMYSTNMMEGVKTYKNDTYYGEYKAVPLKWNPVGVSAEEAGEDKYYGEDGGGIYTLNDYKAPYPADRRKNYGKIIVFLDPGHEYYSTHWNNDKARVLTDHLTSKGSPRAMYPDKITNGPWLEEWEVVRKIAMMVEGMLYDIAPGITVEYTAPVALTKDQTYTGLTRRKMNAVNTLFNNPSKHGVFVSIHLNAASGGDKWFKTNGGWAIFISSNTSLQFNSAPLAESMYKYAKDTWGTNRLRTHNNHEHWGTAKTAGVGYDDYGILCVFNSDNISNADTLKKYNEKWQTVPAVIAENFFQDVLDDAEYIAGNMDVIAGVIVSGIMDYLDNKTTWVENSEAFLNA